jgi:hypothetical protein
MAFAIRGLALSQTGEVGQLPLASRRVRASLDCTPLTASKSMPLYWLTTTSAGRDLCDPVQARWNYLTRLRFSVVPATVPVI